MLLHVGMVDFKVCVVLQNLNDIHNMLHIDKRDRSTSFSFLYQDPWTPAQNRALWKHGNAAPVHICGGRTELFSGLVAHGVCPPEEFDPRYPWYGCTIVRVQGKYIK